MARPKKPLVYLVEDYKGEWERLKPIFEEAGYDFIGFESRKQAFNALQIANRKKQNMPDAVITDIATGKEDMSLQNFIDNMNMRFPNIPLFISTIFPGLIQGMEIIMKPNTKGVFQRVSGMDDLLKRLEVCLATTPEHRTRS